MKKMVVLMTLIVTCLINMNYFVSAETSIEKYEDIYKSIETSERIIELTDINDTYFKLIDFNTTWEIVSINENTITVETIVNVPEIIKDIDINDIIVMYTILPLAITKGEPDNMAQRYKIEPSGNSEKIRLLMSINKSYYNNWCVNTGRQCSGDNPDPSSLRLFIFYNFIAYYIADINPKIDNAYTKGYNDGVKSITHKPITYLLEWTVPFITLVILLGIYVGYKKEWFKE